MPLRVVPNSYIILILQLTGSKVSLGTLEFGKTQQKEEGRDRHAALHHSPLVPSKEVTSFVICIPRPHE